MRTKTILAIVAIPIFFAACSKEKIAAPNENHKKSSVKSMDHIAEIGQCVNDIKNQRNESSVNIDLAEDAYKRSNDFIKSNPLDYEKARLYLLNAINHNPNKIGYYQALFDVVKRENSLESIRDSRAVFNLAVYQVPAINIEDILTFQTELDKIEESLLSLDDEHEKIDRKLLDEALKSLKKRINDDANCTDIEELHQRLEEARRIAESVIDDSSDDLNLKDEINKISKNCAVELKIVDIHSQLNNELQSFNKTIEVDFEKERELTKLSRINQMMNNLWLEDSQDVSSHLRLKIEDAYDEVTRSVNIFNKKHDECYMNIINTKSESITDDQVKNNDPRIFIYAGSLQKKIMRNKVLINIIAKQIESLRDRGNILIASDVTLKLLQENNELKRQQYMEYQKWAGEKLLGCLKKHKDIKVFNDKDAWDLFHCAHEDDAIQSSLCRVDVSLLSPEIKNVYDEVMGFILNEESDLKIEFQKKLMLEDKFTLEMH